MVWLPSETSLQYPALQESRQSVTGYLDENLDSAASPSAQQVCNVYLT